MGCVCMTGIVEVVAAADGTQTVADFHDTQARGNALAVDDPHDFVPPDRRPRLAARGQSGRALDRDILEISLAFAVRDAVGSLPWPRTAIMSRSGT
jgi:hypothetical protein